MTTSEFNHNDLFNQYLKNMLDENTVKKFNLRIATDIEFRNEFNEYKSFYEIYLENDIIETNSIFEEARSDYKRKQLLKKLGLITLFVVIASTLILFWNSHTNEETKDLYPITSTTKKERSKLEQNNSINKASLKEDQIQLKKTSNKQIRESNTNRTKPISIDSLSPLLTLKEKDSTKQKIGPHFPQTKAKDTLNNKQQDVIIDCDALKIQITSKDICINETELGEISIKEIDPIQMINLDNQGQTNFTDYYSDLEVGIYNLHVQFENTCEQTYSVEISEIWCLEEHPIIVYSQNSFWNFTLPKAGVLEIRNRSGVLLAKADITSNEFEYQGNRLNGALLESGAYTYSILLEDGQVKYGSLRVYP